VSWIREQKSGRLTRGLCGFVVLQEAGEMWPHGDRIVKQVEVVYWLILCSKPFILSIMCSNAEHSNETLMPSFGAISLSSSQT